MSSDPAHKKVTRPVRSAIERIRLDLRSIGVRVNRRPIFVIGNQKSGTSAIGALLGEMTGLSVAIDLRKELTSPTFKTLKGAGITMERFVRRNRLDFSRDIVKEPLLTTVYDELALAFPESRFIIVVRDPRDNLRSILNRLEIPGDLASLDPSVEVELSPAWRLVFDGAWLGLPGGHYIDRLAYRWNYSADVYLDHRDRIVLTRYETFMEDKVGEIERLAKTLGLRQKHDITDRVDVPFQPPGDRGVTWQDFFGDTNLGRIDTICHDRMKEFGYEPSG